MTYAEFIEAAVEQFARHGIDVDSRVRAVINNLAMVACEEPAMPAPTGTAQGFFDRARERVRKIQGDGSVLRTMGQACMTCEATCICDHVIQRREQQEVV